MVCDQEPSLLAVAELFNAFYSEKILGMGYRVNGKMSILNRDESSGSVGVLNTGLIAFAYSHFSG